MPGAKTIATKRPSITTDEYLRPDSARDTARIDIGVQTAFDVFGSELSDETFAGVFDQPRPIDKPVDELFRGA
ncbi:hypothetical protein XI01_38485 [Bradyrhizobium sp. CCBAU 21360]|nr:hypothetical protein [Bradyrhizobium sp. CCBAU 21360]